VRAQSAYQAHCRRRLRQRRLPTPADAEPETARFSACAIMPAARDGVGAKPFVLACPPWSGHE